MAEVVRAAGVVLKNGGGGRQVGLCPFHAEKSGSFTVYPENSFYCFGCGAGGDAAEFVMKFYGVDFPEALRQLGVENDGKKPARRYARRPAVNASERGKKGTAPAVYGRPPGLWVEKATKFCVWCHEKLLDNETQMKWLAERGIDEKTVTKRRLGWNPGESDEKPCFFRHRKSWGLPDEVKKNGKKKMLWLPRGLVIPLMHGDDVLRLRIRGERPRYYVVPGSCMDMMIFEGTHRCLVIVESELDAILLNSVAGDLAGYIALGASSAKPDAKADHYIKHSSYTLLALDYDEAGAKALEWWAQFYPRAKAWPIPDGKDPGDAYKDGCDLREWILAGYPDGWHLQLTHNNKWRIKDVPKEKKPTPMEGAVAELAELMKGEPVSVIVTGAQLKILSPPEWNSKNWQKLGRISQLVYFTPEIFDYLHCHGETKITWRNIYHMRV